MNAKKINYEKILSYIALAAFILLLIPPAILGYYNHPTGDDYYYGAFTQAAIDACSGGFFARIGTALVAAFKGMLHEYQIWQGTYSAMYLMFLPPNLLGETAYTLFPASLMIFYNSCVFFFLYTVIVKWLGFSKDFARLTSSLVCITMLQGLPGPGEGYYWFNGSMYYTGYLGLTFILFALMIRFALAPEDKPVLKTVLYSLLAFWIAGGNYVSLLPTSVILLLVTILFFVLMRRETAIPFLVIFISLMIGFMISAFAPGNGHRAEVAPGIDAIASIIESFKSGLLYLKAWTNPFLFGMLAILTPFLVPLMRRIKFRFPLPGCVAILCFCLLSCMCTPTYFGEGTVGHSRAFDLSYYMMVLYFLLTYSYFIGYLVNKTSKKDAAIGGCMIALLAVLFVALLPLRSVEDTIGIPFSARAFLSITNGEASAYREEYLARMRDLEDPTLQNIVWEPYSAATDENNLLRGMIYIGDFGKDPQDLNNLAICTIYGKESVSVNW